MKILVAGIPKSGTMIVWKSLPEPERAKTHLFPDVMYSIEGKKIDPLCRVIFLFGDPILSVISTIRNCNENKKWMSRHAKHCGCQKSLHNIDVINCDDLNTGWNRLTFDLDNPYTQSVGFEFDDIDTFQLIGVNNGTTNIAGIKIDHLYAYNSSNYFNTSRWDVVQAQQELQLSENEFGYNSTGLAIISPNGISSIATINLSGYDNFEMIFTEKKIADYGTDSIRIYFGSS